MTDQDILKKAIEKAVKNGMPTSVIDKGTFYQLYWVAKGRTGIGIYKTEFSPEDCYGLIFSHGFAQALWGEELLFCGVPIKDLPIDREDQVFKTKPLSVKAWTYHLPTMVLQKNPIQYLKKFL